ncbi:MAG: apolipoprotein N-acyltransferase [Endomicrobiales bacterium]|jgi:apolipoprotein N-acyltransferase
MTILLSVISGLLLITIFPLGNIDLLAWVALICLMRSIENVSVRRAALLGFVTGFTAYAGILYWIVPLVKFNCQSTFQAIICLAALAAYLALYVAVWAALVAYVRLTSWLKYVLFSAVAWTALEYARTYVLTGFPWALLGYSQFRAGWILPLARYTGVYGVSWVVVAVNAVLFQWFVVRARRGWVIAGIILSLGVICLRVIIQIPSQSFNPGDRRILVGIMQPSIEQYQKWNDAYRATILATYDAMADEITMRAPQIIVWPETLVPGFLPVDSFSQQWVETLVKRTGVINVIGTPYVGHDGASYNASIVLDGHANVLGVHRKTHLVAFGEYVPLRSIFEPFFGILNTLGDFQRGKQYLPIDADSLRLGISICSENMFGDIARKLTKNGATLLINETNDAWFFNTAAPEQHFIMNVFRAVENNRAVIVSGNTGVSGSISSDGYIMHRTAVFTKTWITVPITKKTRLTFYTKHGDIFAIVCCAITALFMLWRIICLIKCRKS